MAGVPDGDCSVGSPGIALQRVHCGLSRLQPACIFLSGVGDISSTSSDPVEANTDKGGGRPLIPVEVRVAAGPPPLRAGGALA